MVRVNRKKYDILGGTDSISPSPVQISYAYFGVHTPCIEFLEFCFLICGPSVPGHRREWRLGCYCGLYSKLIGGDARTTYGDVVL
jgi:hypothetical protein